MKKEEWPKLSKGGMSWRYPEAEKSDKRPIGACVKQPKIDEETNDYNMPETPVIMAENSTFGKQFPNLMFHDNLMPRTAYLANGKEEIDTKGCYYRDIQDNCISKVIPVSLTPEEIRKLFCEGSIKTKNGLTINAHHPIEELVKRLAKFYDSEQHKEKFREAIIALENIFVKLPKLGRIGGGYVIKKDIFNKWKKEAGL